MPKALKFNPNGMSKLLRAVANDPAVALEKRAERYAEACGGAEVGYYATDLVLEETRGAASVMARSPYARRDNRKHNTLLRKLESARG